MSLEIWRPRGMSPWRVLDEMERSMDEMLGRLPGVRGGQLQAGEWMPTVDMYEEEGNLIIKAELPGVKKDDVDVMVEDHTLTIRGEKHAEHEEKQGNYYVSEASYGEFQRSINLPANVDVDQIEASLQDGTLTITVPEAAQTQAKKVNITGGEGKQQLGQGRASRQTGEMPEEERMPTAGVRGRAATRSGASRTASAAGTGTAAGEAGTADAEGASATTSRRKTSR